MNVVVNGQVHSTLENASLSSMIEQLGVDSRTGIAIAVNQEVVPRTDWEEHTLTADDKIVIITATQGG